MLFVSKIARSQDFSGALQQRKHARNSFHALTTTDCTATDALRKSYSVELIPSQLILEAQCDAQQFARKICHFTIFRLVPLILSFLVLSEPDSTRSLRLS